MLASDGGAAAASHSPALGSRFQIPDCSHIFEMIYSGLETDLTHETFAMNGAGRDNKYRPGTAIHTSSRGKLISISVVSAPALKHWKWKYWKRWNVKIVSMHAEKKHS